MSMSEAYDDLPASPSPLAGKLVTLQVGERRFVTASETLEESGFFSSLLSGRWDNAQPDGSYFIDADPQIFEHIIRYLRRGVLPVFYDNMKGHDHALYLAVLEEAKYFQIPRLEKWIKDREYLEAVKITYTGQELNGADIVSETTRTDTEILYHPSWVTEKVYVCPRDIPSHRGNPGGCGRMCRKAQGENEDEFEDEQVLKVLVIRKMILFNRDICRVGK